MLKPGMEKIFFRILEWNGLINLHQSIAFFFIFNSNVYITILFNKNEFYIFIIYNYEKKPKTFIISSYFFQENDNFKKLIKAYFF